GACATTLLLNKQKIDQKAKLDGNLKSIPVFVMEVKPSKLSANFESNGTFSSVHELTVMSEGQGKLLDYSFAVGDFVNAGKLLAKLDDEILKSQLSLAEAALEKSKSDMKKYTELLKEDAISNQQFEGARLELKKTETDATTLRKQLGFTSIIAPIQGTITKRMIEKGSIVMPGTPIAEIVDVSRLKFIANITESEAALVTKGQVVPVASSIYPGIIYKGVVLSVGVKADEMRRFAVEIELVNDPLHPLKAGMFGLASFASGVERECLTIPRSSIVGSIKEPKVYVAEENHAVLRAIRIGAANDKEVEILDGLKPGERIITSGQINLDNNSVITIVNVK
ncbi:MAG: efflux RND transporter periplasmic adaptor subunit, partial [Bacteroidota bacterium]